MSGFVTIETPQSKEDAALRLECIRLAIEVHKELYRDQSLLQTMRMFEEFICGKNDADIFRAISAVDDVREAGKALTPQFDKFGGVVPPSS